MILTSANSINVARFLPQAFYYFNAYAQLKRDGVIGKDGAKLTFCVPSGNFGNITAGLFAWKMGLPVSHFIAANNANDVFYSYLQTGVYTPMASKQTLANAMDVGAPSNFARILDLYNNGEACRPENGKEVEAVLPAIKKDVSGATYTDDKIRQTMKQCYKETGYVLDPHGACGYKALKEQLTDNEVGVFLETAHPAKFKEKVDSILDTDIAIPERLQAFMRGKKQSIEMPNDFNVFKKFLLDQ